MNFQVMRAVALGALTFAVSAQFPVEAGKWGQGDGEAGKKESKWEVEIGAGAVYGPVYEGSDDMEAQALPFLHLEWNERIFLNPGEGLGVRAYKGENLEVSLSVGYDEGRDDGDSTDLRGLGDIDGSATGNLSIEYELGPVSPYLELSRQFGGADGVLAEIGVETMVPLLRRDWERMRSEGAAEGGDERPNGPALMLGISTTWADDNYMKDYFGVTALQAGRSGLRRYTAGSGFKSADAEIGLMVPIGKHWSFNVQAEYSQLLGDAADSPITRDKSQYSIGSFLSYRF